jgi:hypothetical protein
MARNAGWLQSVGAGTAGFAACAALLQVAELPLWLLALIVYAALASALWLMPPLAGGRARLPAPPPWDLPARMIATTGLVLALTAVAPLVGARMSGLLATYPLFGAVLAAFAHHLSGAAAAGRVLCGLLIGLFGFTSFFVVLALTIEPLGIERLCHGDRAGPRHPGLLAMDRPGQAPSTMKARAFELASRIGSAL